MVNNKENLIETRIASLMRSFSYVPENPFLRRHLFAGKNSEYEIQEVYEGRYFVYNGSQLAYDNTRARCLSQNDKLKINGTLTKIEEYFKQLG